jgi:hypothetical protein
MQGRDLDAMGSNWDLELALRMIDGVAEARETRDLSNTLQLALLC